MSEINDLSQTSSSKDISQFQCQSQYKGKVSVDTNLHKHQDKLSLIVGDKSFINIFGRYCEDSLGMEIIKKSLVDTSSFWVIDSEEIAKHKNYEEYVIKAPFFTNKELNADFKVHYYDYVYLFVNQHGINLKDTFKLMDYSKKINVSCFVIITNYEYINDDDDDNSIQQIEGYLKYSQLNYIIFQLQNVYIADDTKFIHNHHISLLFHQIMKNKGENTEMISNIFDSNYLDILYFEDIIEYIAISPLYQHLYYETFYIHSKQNVLSISQLTTKIINLLKLDKKSDDINNDVITNINYQQRNNNKFDCYFLSENQAINETLIDNILKIILNDLNIDKDIISRKTHYKRFDKSAVFCDNRFDDQMVGIVLNFMINLDQEWQFELYVGNDTIKKWEQNAYLKPYIKTQKVVLKDLTRYYKKDVVEYYSNIEFWQSINHEKILTFHADSVLCSYSKYKISDFLEYDYIGAPWRKNGGPQEYEGRVGNGGLSLRSKSFMIKLLTQYPQKEANNKKIRNLPEDFYLNRRIALLSGVHLPNYRIARRFSIENDHHGLDGHNVAAGIHRHYIKRKSEFEKLVKICAEYEMTESRIHWWNITKKFWD